MRSFEELEIWQTSRLLTVEIYSSLKDNRDFGFKDQIQRASVSIMNNIAEGFDSGSDSVFVRYLNIARGSTSEVKSMLILSKDLKYIDDTKANALIEKSVKISIGITRFITYLERTKTTKK